MPELMTARPRTSDEPQGATFIELFFDLVFVYAVTQVTSVLIHDLTWTGAARAAVVAWLVWWAWTQFTWTLSPADTTHPAVQLTVLASTAVAFFMARSVVETFDGNPWFFVIPYLMIRAIGMALYGWVGGDADRQMRRSMGLFAVASLPAMGAILIGAVLDPALRLWLWAAAILLDLGAGVFAGRVMWRIHVSHFAERHGLIIIIALGESLIAIGVASATLEATIVSFVVKGGGVALVCVLWWLYFGWFKSWLEDRVERSGSVPLLRNCYSFMHYPLIAGVVAIAAALENVVAHNGDPLETATTTALVVGITAYVAGIAAIAWMADRRVLMIRLLILAAAALFIVLASSLQLAGSVVIWVVAAALTLVGLFEYRTASE